MNARTLVGSSLGALVLATNIVACGGDFRQAELAQARETCSLPDGQLRDGSSAAVRLRSPLNQWLKVSGFRDVGPGLGPGERLVTLEDVTDVRGRPVTVSSPLRVRGFFLSDLSLGVGDSYYLVSRMGNVINTVSLISEDRQAAFLGCSAEYLNSQLQEVADALDITTSAALLQIALNPQGVAASRLSEPDLPSRSKVPFLERPASQRQIDPTDESVPRDLLARLQTVRVQFNIPQQWRGADKSYAICGRLPEGYVECVNTRGSPERGLVTSFLSFSPGSELQLWLLPGDADPADALGRIAVVPANLLLQSDLLTVTPSPDVGSLDELAVRARANQIGLIVR